MRPSRIAEICDGRRPAVDCIDRSPRVRRWLAMVTVHPLLQVSAFLQSKKEMRQRKPADAVSHSKCAAYCPTT